MPGEHDSDEIDLIDLIKIIIKRKFVVLITTVFFVSAAGLWLYMKPDSYIATAEIAIGKIAGIPIDAGSEIELYLDTLDNQKSADYKYSIKSEIFNTYNNTKGGYTDTGMSVRLNVTITGLTKENVNNALSSILEMIMQRQDSVYKDAKEEFLKNIHSLTLNSKLEPRFFMKSFTYPSVIVKKTFTEAPVDLKIKQKLIISLIGGFFTGIFMTFVFEFTANIFRRFK